MKTIWKFDVAETIEMPVGAQILSLQTQAGVGVIWALVDTNHPKEERLFKVYGTGWADMPENPGVFIGTFQQAGGMFVYHVFEVTIPEGGN